MAITHTPQGTTKGTASKAAQRKRLKKLRMDETDNGGFIVSHHFHPEHGGTPKAEKHAFSKYDDAHAHLEKTMRGHT